MSVVVGLTCYQEPARWGSWNETAALIHRWYLDFLNANGAGVVLLPPGQGVDAMNRLDGLVLAGGPDIDPTQYGSKPHPRSDPPRHSRDQSELDLYRRARERRIPVLGICRGLQIMAVAHGGRLVQHLPDASTLVHREQPAQFVEHFALFSEGSILGAIYGVQPVKVNSSHHQAVENAGDLRVTGIAEDGTVEACEDPSDAFCVGVQWHPEHPSRREQDSRLASAFVAAAEASATV